jgi:hypothetical protein
MPRFDTPISTPKNYFGATEKAPTRSEPGLKSRSGYFAAGPLKCHRYSRALTIILFDLIDQTILLLLAGLLAGALLLAGLWTTALLLAGLLTWVLVLLARIILLLVHLDHPWFCCPQ